METSCKEAFVLAAEIKQEVTQVVVGLGYKYLTTRKA